MDQKTHEAGEGKGAGHPGSAPGEAGGEREIEATGDAIIIAEAILTLAESFREVAAAIRNATATHEEQEDEDEQVERYLDGSPIRK